MSVRRSNRNTSKKDWSWVKNPYPEISRLRRKKVSQNWTDRTLFNVKVYITEKNTYICQIYYQYYYKHQCMRKLFSPCRTLNFVLHKLLPVCRTISFSFHVYSSDWNSIYSICRFYSTYQKMANISGSTYPISKIQLLDCTTECHE